MTIEVPRGYVYLDWAATAPLSEAAAAAMEPFQRPGPDNIALGMNANSLHAPGRAAFEALEIARKGIAKALGASRPNEVVLTSGATESCNAALFGIARAVAAQRRKRHGSGFVPRVVTTEIEHEAVARPAERLMAEGFEVIRLKPDRQGAIRPDDLEKALDGNAVLVSVQMANSEIGTIQPIARMARMAHDAGALFHTDATQAIGKVPFDVAELGVDAASLSAHKIGGPKGIGALYLKARTPFQALLLGGGQEEGRRSTTQNVCGAAGFAAALEEANVKEGGAEEARRQRGLRDFLYAALEGIDGVSPTVDVRKGSCDFLPNIAHVLVDGYESETLVLRLDMMGFGVSGGSACSSHSLEPSHVLKSIGIGADQAYGALRVSIGRYTSAADLERFVRALGDCIA